MKTHRLRAVALSAALMLLAPFAHASPAGDFVRAKQTQLLDYMRHAKTAEDEKKVQAAFDSALDYDTLAKESLKEAWDGLKPEERTEFQGILTKLVRAAYRKSLKRIRDYDVEYVGESKEDSRAIVLTRAKSTTDNREEPVTINYVVSQASGAWRIVDIVTEGSSLVGNYRSQFRRIIKKQGFPELIRRMKTKLEKGDVD